MNERPPDPDLSSEDAAPPLTDGGLEGGEAPAPEAPAPETPAPEIPTPAEASFEDYGLAPDVMEALKKMGIRVPTPIQALVIRPILAGRDVIGKAETGTGKTIGFGAPLVGKIDTNRVAVQALILAPTRELAQQVAGVLEELGSGRKLGVALVVGGVHASEQVLKLRSGSQVVVGTPGRVLDFLRDRTLSLVWCEMAVLDEADRMLDMGFIDDVTAILDRIPPERQTLLFSATIPPEVQRLSQRYMREPESYSTAKGLTTVSEIRQLYQAVDFRDKFRALRKVLDENPDQTCIIFCNTRRQAIDLDRMLWGHGYAAGALHGEQEQDVRFKILEAFRRREIRILVATDVASRGLDIDDIARIINYEVPDEVESYVHRIGRTGRASKSGIAITLVSGKESQDWRRIVRTTGFIVEAIGSPVLLEGGSGGGWKRERGRGGRGRGGRDARGRGDRGRGRGERRAGGGGRGGGSEGAAAEGGGRGGHHPHREHRPEGGGGQPHRDARQGTGAGGAGGGGGHAHREARAEGEHSQRGRGAPHHGRGGGGGRGGEPKRQGDSPRSQGGGGQEGGGGGRRRRRRGGRGRGRGGKGGRGEGTGGGGGGSGGGGGGSGS